MSAEEHPQPNPLIPKQSRTPYHISGKPEKQDLVDEYKGKNLDALRTPALIIDRAVGAPIERPKSFSTDKWVELAKKL